MFHGSGGDGGRFLRISGWRRQADVGIERAPRSTSFRRPAVGGNTVLRFGVLGGVHHQYPNGRDNPEGFAGAPEFRDFFASHPLR